MAMSISSFAARSSTVLAARPARPQTVAALRPLARQSTRQSAVPFDVQRQLVKAATFSSAAATFLAAGNANAAQEIADLAAGDGRLGTLSLLLVPVLGWVAFNIGGPALSQLKSMDKGKGAFAAGLGLSALLLAQQADAAQEVAQLAEKDSRVGILATLFLPVLGWVAFNIGGPALNQLKQASQKSSAPTKGPTKKKRSTIVGLGMGLGLLGVVGGADAATEVAQIAAGDGRLGLLTTLLIPVVGWVAFNIFGPAKNQLDQMSSK